MRPIFMSPNDKQVHVIQAILRQQGIDSSVIVKKNPSNKPNSKPNVTWSEVWLRKEQDSQRAREIITQYQFNTLKGNIRTPVSPDVTAELVVEDFAKTQRLPRPPHSATQNSLGKRYQEQGDEAWLPVNNKRVFSQLGNLLGVIDESDAGDHHNNVLRPWNSKSLMERVKNLKLICR